MAKDTLFDIDKDFGTIKEEQGPVTCFGMTFANDSERREYFREELRKKLPELKKIEGFPIGEDEDIINLSDPPYYTACPNPWLNDFIEEWEKEKIRLEKEGIRSEDFEVREPYASDVSEGKNNPIYNFHTYHTKVPHPAIMKYLQHYTQPGDIIFDGFCGSGMTGVASGMPLMDEKKQRHCICSDLSPIASFIAYNMCNNYSQNKQSAFLSLLKSVKNEYSYLYNTNHSNGEPGEIQYVVWSDVAICPHCAKEITFWDTFIEYGLGITKKQSICSCCGGEVFHDKLQRKFETKYDVRLKKNIQQAAITPVLISYKYKGKRYVKTPDSDDLSLLEKMEFIQNPSWVPTNLVPDGYNTNQPKQSHGYDYIHQYYPTRTLFILSKIWEKCDNSTRIFITNCIARNATFHNRFIVNKYNLFGRINGPYTGTLYIPSEKVEQNIFQLLEERTRIEHGHNFKTAIQVGDMGNICNIASSSVDYIFTDPPFGANYMYSDLNFEYESWIKVWTNNVGEAIENPNQGKDVFSYGDIMYRCFKEYYRILKSNKWMTVEFSNTKSSVWNAIQSAITRAGFIVANVSSLDKKHAGIKSKVFSTTVNEDLIITCFKPSFVLQQELKDTYNNDVSIWDLVEELLSHLPIHIVQGVATSQIVERSPKIIYDKIVSFLVEKGATIPFDAFTFQQGLRERFIEKDGMFFTASQAAEYEEKKKHTSGFAPMGIIVSDEANGIQWLRNELGQKSQTYQDLQPKWMQALLGKKKGDIIPEMQALLDENFIKESDGKWRIPDANDEKDLEILRTKALLKEFNIYVEQANKPKSKIKEARVEALRAGFKQCYIDKDFKTIIMVGDKIPENLLTEDEVLLQYYDIASSRV